SLRPLRKLERAAFDFVRHPSAGHLLLGFAGLSCRRPGVPADRIGSACVIGAGPWLSDPRIARCDGLDDLDPGRGAFHLGLSSNLYSAMGQRVVGEARSIAAVAESLHNLLHRSARRSLTCSRTGNSLYP